jgi:ParB-like nuclease domain
MNDLQHWPPDRLIEYARNPRKNDHAVDKMASVIREFGFRVPVLAKSDGSLVDGHLRLKAAKKLSLETIPVLLVDDLTDTQIKALRLSVNRMADLGEWDHDLLALEIEELRLDGFDLDLAGFDSGALEGIFDEAAGDDGVQELGGMPELPTGEKEPFQQITFTLHDSQADQVGAAMDLAKRMGAFIGSPNENGNGNAISRICETFITQNGNG